MSLPAPSVFVSSQATSWRGDLLSCTRNSGSSASCDGGHARDQRTASLRVQ